jgi:hypothetical protein
MVRKTAKKRRHLIVRFKVSIRKIKWLSLLFLILISSAQVVSTESKSTYANRFRNFRIFQLEAVPQQNDTLRIHYVCDTLKKNGTNYLRHLSDSNKKIILSLNRISENKLRAGMVLVVPDTLITDLLVYSPFPSRIDSLTQIPKCILISQRIQAFGIYENGELIKWGPVSTGKKSTPTPNGIFYTNWKSRLKISSIDSNWIMPWYINIDNQRGIALHEYELPGFPASHGCIRLLSDDAIWIYNWAEEWMREKKNNRLLKNGTPVIIFGKFDFQNKPVWHMLPVDPNSNLISQDEIETIVKIYSQR